MNGAMRPRAVDFRGVTYWIYPNGLALPAIRGADTYDPTTWANGVAPGISAAELNRMEAGIDESARVIDLNTTQVNVTATTTQTAIYQYTIPAGELDTSGVLEAVVFGSVMKNLAGKNCRFVINLGGTEIMKTIDFELPAQSGAFRPFVVRYTLIVINQASDQHHLGELHIATPSAEEGWDVAVGPDPSTVQAVGLNTGTAKDLSAAQQLSIEFKWDFSSSSLNLQKASAYTRIHANT